MMEDVAPLGYGAEVENPGRSVREHSMAFGVFQAAVRFAPVPGPDEFPAAIAFGHLGPESLLERSTYPRPNLVVRVPVDTAAFVVRCAQAPAVCRFQAVLDIARRHMDMILHSVAGG